MAFLTDVFAKTDTISHGPFQVSKQPGAPWAEATATVEGRRLPLNASEKRLLALLISHEGAIVQHSDMLLNTFPQKTSRNPCDSVMKVHIHNLRKKIRGLNGGDPYAAMIHTVNEARKGSRGTKEERDARRTGYRLIPAGP